MRTYNFDKRFVNAIIRREKRQTIRVNKSSGPRRRPPKVCEFLNLETGKGTDQWRRLGSAEVTAVELITIDPVRRLMSMPRAFGSGLAWMVLDTDEVEQIARDDGFADADDLFAWFGAVYGSAVNGALVKWEFL